MTENRWSFGKDVWASVIGAVIAVSPFVVQFAIWMANVQQEQAVQKAAIENIQKVDQMRQAQMERQLDKLADDVASINHSLQEYILREAK
jgi:TolA-binding protein